MFKIKADPTFDAVLTIIGQGREQVLKVTFRHKTRSVYAALLQSMSEGKLEAPDLLLQLIEKWDADAELNLASLAVMQEHQPGMDWAIITGYGDALTVARKGNSLAA